MLQKQVSEPWRQLVTRAKAVEAMLSKARDEDPAPSRSEREQTRRDGREQIQTASWYVLLDLAKFLEGHLPSVWACLTGAAPVLSPAEAALVSAIANASYTRDGSTRTMRSALTAIRSRETQLELARRALHRTQRSMAAGTVCARHDSIDRAAEPANRRPVSHRRTRASPA